MPRDSLGNEIDVRVGFARGRLIASSADEVRRLRHGGALAGAFIAEHGSERLGIFTGNLREFRIGPEDLVLCEEWAGPGIYGEELRLAAIGHLGGHGHEAVAVVNRTSAGLAASVLAFAGGRDVVVVVPPGDRAHASVSTGAGLAGVAVRLVSTVEDFATALHEYAPKLVIVTTVTSELAAVPDDVTQACTDLAKAADATVLLDEAYGARFRTAVLNGRPSLSFGADLVITNADKAGLSGPRAGVFCGEPEAVVRVQAKASELGMEARAPIAVGAMRSLQSYRPDLLIQELEDGRVLSDALVARFGEGHIVRGPLGPKLDEDEVLRMILARRGIDSSPIVPVEATTAVGMLMLSRAGVLTVNTHGQPGCRASIRFKPTLGALTCVGGASTVVDALDEGLSQVAGHIDDLDWLSETIFGDA